MNNKVEVAYLFYKIKVATVQYLNGKFVIQMRFY